MTEWPPPPIDSPRRRSGPALGLFALRGGKTIVTLVSLIVLTVTWYGWQFIGDVNAGLATTDVFDDPAGHAKPLDGAIDILLVGQDSRTDAQGNPLPREVLDMLHAGISDGERQTDTMILVHIPQSGKKAVAISFPRDSLVDITGGFGKHKLNSAFVYAYNDTFKTLQRQGESDLKKIDERAKLAGRKNLIATLEKFIGKPGMIDRYAEVNLSSFYEVTKAIGGIEVCLNAAVKEQKSGVDLPAGRQVVEGVQALAFVRQRYALVDGDLGRIARQQAFLSGLANKVVSSDVLTSPSKITDLVSAVKKSVVLSADWDLIEFAQQMRGLTGGNIEFRTIPTQGGAKFGGADVIRVEPAEVRTFVNRLTTDEGAGRMTSVPAGTPSAPGSTELDYPGAPTITVDVFNGSGNTALASSTLQALTGQGFRRGSAVPLAPRSTTVLRYHPAEADSAALVQQAFADAAQVEPDGDVPAGHVRVLLGRDLRGLPTTPATSAGASPSSPTSVHSPTPPTARPITAGGVPCVN